MKNILFLFLFVCSNTIQVKSQIVADTFGNSNSGISCISLPNQYLKGISWSIFTQNELAQKGIVPGVMVYGMAFKKIGTGYILPGINATLKHNFRSGGQYNNLMTLQYIMGNYLSPNANYYNYLNQFNSFTHGLTTTYGNNNNSPQSPGWYPFYLNNPFVYTGGALEMQNLWNADTFNCFTGAFSVAGYTPINSNIALMLTQVSNDPNYTFFTSMGSGGGSRQCAIIYHSPAPIPCNDVPSGGNVKGPVFLCPNDTFHLYLENPSAGPGISYQWQISNTSPISWTNIVGETFPSLKSTAPSTSKLYRCLVTCNNINHTTPSTNYTLNPNIVHVDSITSVVTGSIVTVTAHVNVDTTLLSGSAWQFGDSNQPSLGWMTTQHHYTIDSTYYVKFLATNGCMIDSLIVPITVGCPGGSTFINAIGAEKDTTCPNGAVQLQVLDTVPSNFTISWVQYTQTGYTPIPGVTGASITQYPTVTTGYYSKATCNITGNSKQSNLVTVNVTTPPIAGSITATNTTGNLYQFTNNGMYNAQSYVWYFGDGDTSTQLSPIHHYNWAGNYTAMLVATNAGNGCTDTATTQVSITTSVEELPNESSFNLTPNPFKDNLQLTTRQPVGSITIYDPQGKKLKQQTIKTTTTIIDLKGMPSGVYLLEYDNGTKKESRKVVKE